MPRRLALTVLLCLAALATAEDPAPLAETKSLLAIAEDTENSWRARAAALRTLARTDDAPSAALAKLARSDKAAVLRRLALAALTATAKDDQQVGEAVAVALSDEAPGVRREALVAVTTRAAACTGTLDAVIARLRDDEPLLRAHAARAVAALADEAVDVHAAAEPLLPLLADEDAGPLAARALLAARPSRTQLAKHIDALQSLVRARGGPVPAALVLSIQAGREGEMWERALRAYAEAGSRTVRQAALTAIATLYASRSPRDPVLPAGSMSALEGPDSLILATALRVFARASFSRKVVRGISLGEELKHHESKLVRTLARRILADDDQ